jgi:hypothetical protein
LAYRKRKEKKEVFTLVFLGGFHLLPADVEGLAVFDV